MRKHNTKFAQRWHHTAGDRSNFPQQMAHNFVNNKAVQFYNNELALCIATLASSN